MKVNTVNMHVMAKLQDICLDDYIQRLEYVFESSNDFSKVIVSLEKFKKRGDIKGNLRKTKECPLQEKNRRSFQWLI